MMGTSELMTTINGCIYYRLKFMYNQFGVNESSASCTLQKIPGGIFGFENKDKTKC